MNGRMMLLNGHQARQMYGFGWLIETEPGSNVFLFPHDEEARRIMDDHNALYFKQHGGCAVARPPQRG